MLLQLLHFMAAADSRWGCWLLLLWLTSMNSSRDACCNLNLEVDLYATSVAVCAIKAEDRLYHFI
jgi:hypothetical protein